MYGQPAGLGHEERDLDRAPGWQMGRQATQQAPSDFAVGCEVVRQVGARLFPDLDLYYSLVIDGGRECVRTSVSWQCGVGQQQVDDHSPRTNRIGEGNGVAAVEPDDPEG